MTLRFDGHASIAMSPTAMPHVMASSGTVFRGMADLDEAKAYADQVCAWFASQGVATHVFVVKGPTSTTRSAYEVVEATCGHTVLHRAMPPSPEEAIDAAVDAARAAGRPQLTAVQREIVGDRARTRHEQEARHYTCLMDALTGYSGVHRSTSVARCHDFIARKVACINASHRGRAGWDTALTIEFLARPWEAAFAEELDQLFRAYVRAGYVRLHQSLSQCAGDGTQVASPSALEYAVTHGKTRLMVAMLEEGADAPAVPASDYGRVAGGPLLAKAGDLLAFIAAQGHTDVDGMLAAAKEALMRARIRTSGSAETSTMGQPAGRRRPRVV